MINKERKEEMKMKRLIKASTLLMAAALFAACANEDITQQDKENEALKGGVIFTTNGPKISAKRLSIDGEEEFVGAKTRTTITHTPGQGADVYWTNDDFIWVLNRNNQWKKSRNIILHDGGASAEFRLRGSASDYKDGCVVVYSKWGTALSTRIPAYQPQTTPNNFNSAGDWGDCGMGVARNTGNAAKFNFTLKHLPSYLCFLPRCQNATLGQNIILTNISFTTDNPSGLADNRQFSGEHIDNGPSSYTSQVSQTITLSVSNFRLSNTSDNPTLNACYAVIIPGTHNLTVNYTIRDASTNIETTVSQKISGNFKEGEINDIRMLIDRDLKSISNDIKYYMWDAQVGYDYWWGTTEGSMNYPQLPSDPRYFHQNPGYVPGPITATRSCRDCPNVNEMYWYAMRGDPHWTDHAIYVENGHLQKRAGIWLKKKAAILRDNTDVSIWRFTNSSLDRNGVERDWRTEDYRNYMYPIANVSSNPIPNTEDYFFLPALGFSYGNTFASQKGSEGHYWTSSGFSDDGAYQLGFNSSSVKVAQEYSRRTGQVIQKFE